MGHDPLVEGLYEVCAVHYEVYAIHFEEKQAYTGRESEQALISAENNLPPIELSDLYGPMLIMARNHCHSLGVLS